MIILYSMQLETCNLILQKNQAKALNLFEECLNRFEYNPNRQLSFEVVK